MASRPEPAAKTTTFLLFRLWGAMAAWGDIAVGERRGTWARPSRSAILGLTAACLGIERSNRTGHEALEAGLGFAVLVEEAGRPLRDYHTAQSPSARRDKRWSMRRDELDPDGDLNTILSERVYQLEARAVIALWRRPGAACATLDEIAARLVEPVFMPYLGRKACPLGLPLEPSLIDAATPVAAFADFADRTPLPTEIARFGRPVQRSSVPELWMDEADVPAFGMPPDMQIVERTTRRDRSRDRPRWLFADRAEVRIAPAPVRREEARS